MHVHPTLGSSFSRLENLWHFQMPEGPKIIKLRKKFEMIRENKSSVPEINVPEIKSVNEPHNTIKWPEFCQDSK